MRIFCICIYNTGTFLYALYIYIYIYIYISKVKLATEIEGDQKAPFYCKGSALLLSLDCSTLPLICTFYCWVLSKEVSSTIFNVFGMTRPGIELRSPWPLASTLPTWPMSWFPRGWVVESLIGVSVSQVSIPALGI